MLESGQLNDNQLKLEGWELVLMKIKKLSPKIYLALLLLFSASIACECKENSVGFLKEGDITFFDNATRGFTPSDRDNSTITKAVIYWSFNALWCNKSEIDSCDLFNPRIVFDQAQSYNVSFNYYIPDNRIYRLVKDSDIAWSSRGWNQNTTAIRMGYLNETWAQAKSNSTGHPVSWYNQPTYEQYETLAKLIATMNLVWGYRIDEIILFNQINPDFPDPNFSTNIFNEKLEPYHLTVDRNNNLTFVFGC